MEENKLKSIFNDALGSISIIDFVKQAAKQGIKESDSKAFYKSQKVNQITKQVRDIGRKFIRISVPHPGFISADLMDFSKFAKYNHGYKYILTVIDIYSRYAWAFPLKTKSPNETIKGIEKVAKDLAEHGYKWVTFTIDYGTEFLGEVKNYMDKHKIKIYIAQNRDNLTFKLRAAIIERFNRTLSERLTKATIINDNANWVDILPKVVELYNNKVHRATGQTPWAMFVNKKKAVTYRSLSESSRLPIGTYVRHMVDANTFDKVGLRGKNKWSDEIYQVIWREGNRYFIAKEGTIKRLPTSYLARQLLVTNPLTNEMTKIDTLPATKVVAKKAKKFITLQRRSGLDVNDKGDIVEPRPERLLGIKGRTLNKDAKRQGKLPSRLLD